MIKNTLPDKSGNLESLKILSKQLETSSNNVHIVGKNMLRAFYKLFCLCFVYRQICERKMCSKEVTCNLRETVICNSL